MIVFEKLRYKNILSTGDEFIEFDLNTIDLTLILGKNGGGKTTMIDALHFCLYGKPFRDINKNMLINSINRKGLVTEATFRVGPNLYKCVRGIKPNVFDFYKNDELVPKDAKVVDYQKQVDKVLGIGMKSFGSQVVLGSRTFVPFMRLDSKDRRTVVEDLLDLEIFTAMNKVNRENIVATEGELSELDKELRSVSSKLELEKTRVSLVRGNIDESVDRIERKIIALEAQKEGTIEEAQTLEVKINELVPLTLPRKALDTKFGKYNTARTRLEGQVYECERTVSFYESNDHCPKCQQSITTDFKRSIVEQETTAKSELEARIRKAQEYINGLSDEIEAINKVERSISELRTDLAVRNSSIRSLDMQIDACRREIRELQKPTVDFADIEASIAKWQASYDDVVTSKNIAASHLEYLKATALILKDTGIKAAMIKQYIPIMNGLINKYLGIMGFNIAFELNETFSETIKSQYKEAYSYGSFSEGEKMRLDLAIMFAWRDVAKLRNTTATNLLVMDEVLDASLDQDGAEDFLSIVRTMAKETNTIIISHKSEHLMDRFTKVIKFTKVKKFSQMKVMK